MIHIELGLSTIVGLGLLVIGLLLYALRIREPNVSRGVFLDVATLVFGLRPRQKGLQGGGPKGSPGVTSETPRSVGECEVVSHHTPKATPTLGEGVSVDSRNFRDQFEGTKLNGLWRSLYHWKTFGT
jgi:hypothetical protein